MSAGNGAEPILEVQATSRRISSPRKGVVQAVKGVSFSAG